MLTVLVIDPCYSPEVREIAGTDTLTEMQALVGGLIECLPACGAVAGDDCQDIDHDVSIVINEEGKLLDLPFNAPWGSRDVLVGPIVIARYDKEGEQVSLTPRDIEFWSEFYNLGGPNRL